MSIWDSFTDGVDHLTPWKRWPTPFGWTTDVKTIICNENMWMGEIGTVGAVVGALFWTDFIPSPVEIERKTVTGSYKCGFYLLPKQKGLVEVLFGKGTQRVVARVQRPFTTGLFYMWAADTAFDAMAAWTMLIHKKLFCAIPEGDCLLMGGFGTFGGGNITGGIPNSTVEYEHWPDMGDTHNQIRMGAGDYELTGGVLVSSGNHTLNDFRAGFLVGSEFIVTDYFSSIAPFQTVEILMKLSGTLPDTNRATYQFRFFSAGLLPPHGNIASVFFAAKCEDPGPI